MRTAPTEFHSVQLGGNIRRRLAFTLVELLVSMAVFSLLVVLVAAAVNQMLDIAQRSGAQANRIEGAGTALDQIRRDVTAAMLPPFSNPSAGISGSGSGISPLQFALTTDGELPPMPPGLALDSGRTLTSSVLAVRAPVGVDREGGDVTQVLYLLDWEEASGMPPVGTLRRYAPAFEEITDDDPFTGFLSENVIAFAARAVVNSSPAGFYSYNAAIPPDGLPPGLPNALEVALVVLDPQAATRLTEVPRLQFGGANPTRDEFNQDIQDFIDSLPPGVQRGARVFRTSIPIINSRIQ